MKIEELEVSGLRSHRGNPSTCVDLTDKRLVAIVGHTGAGKSSLLEAITFVLFGEATYGGKAYEELSTDGRCEMTVKMTFSISDERFQMLRTVRPDIHGKFMNKVVYLRRVDDADNVLTHTEGVRNVDTAVTALLGGMTREQFCQAVLLAQNRFADLLEANPAEREALLDTLLGLNALHDARSALQKTRSAAVRNIARLTDRRGNLPPDPAAEARNAKALAKAMTTLAEQAAEGGKQLDDLYEEAADLSQKANELERATALRTTAGGPAGRDRLAETAANLETIAAVDGVLAAAEQETSTGLQAARSASNRPPTRSARSRRSMAPLATTRSWPSSSGSWASCWQRSQVRNRRSPRPKPRRRGSAATSRRHAKRHPRPRQPPISYGRPP